MNATPATRALSSALAIVRRAEEDPTADIVAPLTAVLPSVAGRIRDLEDRVLMARGILALSNARNDIERSTVLRILARILRTETLARLA